MATLRFVVEAGIGARGGIKKKVKTYCFMNSLECKVSEDKGWISSELRFEIIGEPQKIIAANHMYEELVATYNS